MSSVESPSRRPGRGHWFGRSSLTLATMVAFLNVVPVTLNSWMLFYFIPLYALELVLTPILCLIGGKSRKIGSGLAVAIGSTATLLGIFSAFSFLYENL